MISLFDVTNFKSIKSRRFELKNINVLLGQNGVGKSSVIQALLALRQSPDPTRFLQINGDYVRLGYSIDVLYQYANSGVVRLGLVEEGYDPLTFSYLHQSDSDVLVAEDHVGRRFDSRPSVLQTRFFIQNPRYLQATRTEPKSLHRSSPHKIEFNRDLGHQGEYAVHFIDRYQYENVEFDNMLHQSTLSTPTRREAVVRNLLRQINAWMGEISQGINVRTKEISSRDIQLSFDYQQPTLGYTNRFMPENVGYGISYCLPVVTMLLSARPGDLIIIENPESHIHPRGQVELGKLLALTAANDVQLIVETHSDHIVNGIRVAVKDELVRSDRVALFYFEREIAEREQYSRITDVFVDRRGALSRYPKNMLDEWGNQLSKLI